MDTFSKSARSKLMSRIRSTDTRPEMIIRRLLFSRGFRYRLHTKDLPGKPDIAVLKFKTAIFVHGCFWHGCTRCDRGTRVPKTNTEKWVKKISENRARDARVQSALEAAGWRVLVFWSCDLRDTVRVEEQLLAAFV